MVETTHPPKAPARPPAPDRLLRFDRIERAVHWANALLFGALIVTGAALYLEPIGRIFGRRHLVEEIHVYCGLALPVPVLLALAGRWGRGLRADLHRLNRWSSTDRTWLRLTTRPRLERHRRRAKLPIGKFNAGQKLNAAFIAGSILVMLGTGSIMRWYYPWPLAWRTGATFVHDWLALGLGVVIIGHVMFALADRDALRSMFRGTISRAWARRHAPGWLDETEKEDAERT
jgi:formate dehydrogenase gamma subunit